MTACFALTPDPAIPAQRVSFGTSGHRGCAFATVVEVLAANGVDTMVDAADGSTPTPVISNAIMASNRSRTSGLADGIVIAPSHNPPEDGGIKGMAENGWFAARPSGTETIFKSYTETFGGEERLEQVQQDGRALIEAVFAAK